jgi:hypothetical protein
MHTCQSVAKSVVGGKEVCHLWEIGGGSALAKLLDVPLNESTVKNVVIAIVVDLSKPVETLATIVFWLERIRVRLSEVEKSLKTKKTSEKVMDQLRERSAKRFGEKHPDNLGKDGAVGKVRVYVCMRVCIYGCVCVCMDQLRERSAKRLGEKYPDNYGKDGAVGNVCAINTWKCDHTHIAQYVCVCLHDHIPIHLHMLLYAPTHISIHVHVHMHIYAHDQIIFPCMCTCLFTHMSYPHAGSRTTLGRVCRHFGK